MTCNDAYNRKPWWERLAYDLKLALLVRKMRRKADKKHERYN